MNHFGLGVSLMFARRYGEAKNAFTDAKALGQDDVSVNMWLGITYYVSGDFERARATCVKAGEVNGPWCLYLAYTKVNFFFDPSRNEPRFQAIERELKFPPQ